MSDVADRVRKIVVEHLAWKKTRSSEGRPSSTTSAPTAWTRVELVMLEEEFGIEIPETRPRPPDLRRCGEVHLGPQ